MRTILLAAAAAPMLLLAAVPRAEASVIVQEIAGLHQDLGDFTPFDVAALPFDPLTGELQDVTIELIGSVLPMTANDLGPFPAITTLTTRVFLFATNGGPTSSFVLGSQPDVPVNVASEGAAGIATGATASVDQVFHMSDLAAFETGLTGPQSLFDYGFRTSNTLSSLGGVSDLTSFSGSAIITYTYAVPEPASVALFCLGLLGVAAVRRRANGSPHAAHQT